MRRGIALVAMATVLFTGCGGEDKPRTIPVGDLIAALDQTKGAPSQRVHVETTNTSGLQTIELKGDGVIDNRTQKGRLSLDMSGRAEGRMEQIIHGFTIWMKWDALSEQLGTDKQWVKMDVQKLGEQQGYDLTAVFSGHGDPTSQLDQLRAISGDVEVVGDETVRGVKTTHYRATIDLRRYPEVAKTEDRDRVRKSIDRLIELTGTSRIPTEIWVGHDARRIHKTRSNAKYKVNGESIEMDIVMELYDFGAPVGDTSPPPPEDVYDLVGAAPRPGG